MRNFCTKKGLRNSQAFSILNGSNGLSKTTNTLNITGWGQGILEFTNPITTLNLTADGVACCSGHSMTVAAGGGHSCLGYRRSS